MPEAPDTRDYPVRGYFHQTDRRTGDLVFYHPDGGDGWPSAAAVFVGVPGSAEVLELFAGAGGQQGPLIGEPDDGGTPVPAEPGPTGPTSKSGTKAATESTLVTTGKGN